MQKTVQEKEKNEWREDLPALFFIFICVLFFRAAAQLTKRLEEAETVRSQRIFLWAVNGLLRKHFKLRNFVYNKPMQWPRQGRDARWLDLNSPFSSCLCVKRSLPCKTFHMDLDAAYRFIFMQIKLIKAMDKV